MKITHPDVRRIVKDAAKRGWSASLTRNSHLRLQHTSGAIVFTGTSPSDRRSIRNLEAQLRRYEREEP